MNSEVKEIIAPLDEVPWKIYLCTTDESALEVYAEHGIHDQNVMKFLFHVQGDEHIVVARVRTIDREMFALVVNTAYSVGFTPSYVYFERLLRQFD